VIKRCVVSQGRVCQPVEVAMRWQSQLHLDCRRTRSQWLPPTSTNKMAHEHRAHSDLLHSPRWLMISLAK
jgi:hypothetical protein